MRDAYSEWLNQQGLADGTVTAQLHRAGRVEECYGDLDEHYDKDQLISVITELRYTAADKRSDKPNPSKIPFNGDAQSNLASYKHAVERYCRFRRDTSEDDLPVSNSSSARTQPPDDAYDSETGQLIGLERDMQTVLRRSIDQLETGLTIIDDGAERSVSSGFIDITARDSEGKVVVVELKTGTARQKAVAQILSYMGDIAEETDEPVRGILVAGDFDKKARAAARMVPNLELKRYTVQFQFGSV